MDSFTPHDSSNSDASIVRSWPIEKKHLVRFLRAAIDCFDLEGSLVITVFRTNGPSQINQLQVQIS